MPVDPSTLLVILQNGGILAHLFGQCKHLFVEGLDANTCSC